MDLSGERFIAAPKDKIWAALNDPHLLKACIPGCESLEKNPGKELKTVVAIKFGPVDTRFSGKALVSEIDAPNGCTISGEAQSGIAGNIHGGGTLKLADAAGGTNVSYYVNAELGGKIAQLSPALIEPVINQMVDAFFMKFSEAVTPPAHAEPTPPGASPYHNLQEDHDHDPSNPHYFGLPVGVIIAAAIAAISVAITLLKFVLT